MKAWQVTHYGEPEVFGLTRKPFVTPLGRSQVDQELVARLAETAGSAARMEDFCHSVEHSIEFQVVFLQLLFGPDIRILPILCGPFARATQLGGRPEDDPGVARFLEAIEKLAREEDQRLLWVLGIDMSHMGRRYGDTLRARAAEGEMASVERRDRERIERLVRQLAQRRTSGIERHTSRRPPMRFRFWETSCANRPGTKLRRSVGPSKGLI